MIEFKQASSGTQVHEALINDVRAYLFTIDGAWRLTANELRIVGQPLNATTFQAAKYEALRHIEQRATTIAETLRDTARKALEEAQTMERLQEVQTT